MNSDQIKVVNNFLSEAECLTVIEIINKVINSDIDKFAIYQNGKRLALQFGKDLYHEHSSHLTLDTISEHEKFFRKYFTSVINETKKLFNDNDEMFMSSFWIAKQFSGSAVPEHEDTDGGTNMHFEYSAIIYLNSLPDSGELFFPSLNYSYLPKAGDLLVFRSKSTGTHVVEKINGDRYSLPMWITKDGNFSL